MLAGCLFPVQSVLLWSTHKWRRLLLTLLLTLLLLPATQPPLAAVGRRVFGYTERIPVQRTMPSGSQEQVGSNPQEGGHVSAHTHTHQKPPPHCPNNDMHPVF